MRAWIAPLCCLALAGCGAELLTTTAVTGGLQARQAGAALGHLERAKEASAQTALSQALQTYTAEKGAPPPSLEALVPEYLPSLPVQPDGAPWVYNPATGRVYEHAGPQPEDRQTIERIQAAIYQYGTATGYYPPTLDHLAPAYLPAPPRTAAGEQFLYNNQDGDVRHPRQGMAAPNRPARAPVGGGGPLGETMTGIGIQQDLGNMNQSGANAAGNRARSGARAVGGDHNARQNQVMDGLGL
jgi:hypothetical protein